MSDGKATDSDLTYSVVDEVADSGNPNPYEIPIKCINNPVNGYTILDKAEIPEGSNHYELPGPVSSCHAEAYEDREKGNALPLKNSIISSTYVIVLVVAVVLIAAGIVFTIAFVEISKLHSEVAVLQLTSPKQTETIQALQSAMDLRINDVRSELNNSEKKLKQNLENISNSISSQQSDICQLNSRVNNNTHITEVLATLLDVQHEFDSCAAIQKLWPLSPSGYYNILSSNGFTITAYCNMTISCGGITGGWIRVAELDMTDTTTQCPDSLELRTSPLRTCTTVNSGTATCSSDIFSVDGVPYSKVCGKIRAYQVRFPDAFGLRNPSDINIDANYVDGVSLTHGSTQRQHIWTFACAANEDDQEGDRKCPCTNTAISDMATPPPPFVGDDYFCDTAVATGFSTQKFYNSDPLWDGAGCGPQSTCCSFNSPPWFYKQLPQTTTDDIEMRVCRNHGIAYENIAIEIVQLYVQ